MRNFEKELLNKLLDKYENSKLSKGGTSINRQIKLTTKDDVLSTYNSIDSYKYVDENDIIIQKIEKLGFIKSKYEGDRFISLSLNVENVDLIYKHLNRERPSIELNKVNQILSNYNFNGFVDDFIKYIKEFITNKYDYPKSYFDDSKQLDLILQTLQNMLSLTEEIRMRNFSVKYLGNSKTFESIKGKIIKIIKDFDPVEYYSDDEALASYNIIKNTSYALVKNKLLFKINEVTIDLDTFGYEFSLSDEMIKKMVIIESNVKKVITVENLTSFYSINEDALTIYLGGFHNHTKQMLLKKVYEKYPNADYFHFGDIDAGGFWILNTLKEKTGIQFKPFKMGVKELSDNKAVLKTLTNNDKKRLSNMLSQKEFAEFKDVIAYMLENDVKLEQESLDIM